MKRQYRAAIAAYTAAVIAVLGGAAYKNHLAADFYRLQAQNCYRRAFYGLAAGIEELDSALQKSVFSGTPYLMGQTLTRVFGAAETAKQALGGLPNGDTEFIQTSGFITKTGDYAFALTKKIARGETVSDEEAENLKRLSETASVLSGNLTELFGELGEGKLSLSEVERRAAAISEDASEDSENIFRERVKAAEEEFPEIPTLIYDGPFSSHIGGMTPRMLEGKAEVTREEAQKIAESFLGAAATDYGGERAGSLPVYRFSSGAQGETVNIEVSKTGGAVVNMYSSRVPDAVTADTNGEGSDTDGAVRAAERFLSERGYAHMRESYRMTRDGAVTVNFAYEQDGVICYTDLIKVDVALDTGEVSGFEAQGYIMHHRERELPDPAISEEEARGSVCRELNVLSHSLAVIPTDGENEAFCHEFKCEAPDGRRYIAYIDAETGREERVLILLEDENGTLAM
ncbi:MAG: germination protein YpeB [Oscillospiraceae bacterium]|jgi:germination protein YpeB|nr:germination protein YpeB [Oscillospiraceae bacterium]